MTKRNLARVSMFDVMVLFFARYAAIADRLPAFRAAIDRFIRFLEQTKRAMVEERLVSQGITTDKGKQREMLCSAAGIVAGAASAYAGDKGNSALLGELDFSGRDFGRMAEDKMMPAIRRIIEQVEPHVAQLGDYGITANTMTQLTTLADLFEGKVAAPRSAVNQRSDAGERAAELVAQTGAVLKKTIDKLILQFQASDPEFYSQYWKSRIIVDAATAGTSLTVNVSDANDQPLAAAEVRVEGLGVVGITDAHGKCILKDLEPGTTRVTIRHASYAQKTLDGVKLKAGKKNKVKAAL